MGSACQRKESRDITELQDAPARPNPLPDPLPDPSPAIKSPSSSQPSSNPQNTSSFAPVIAIVSGFEFHFTPGGASREARRRPSSLSMQSRICTCIVLPDTLTASSSSPCPDLSPPNLASTAPDAVKSAALRLSRRSWGHTFEHEWRQTCKAFTRTQHVISKPDHGMGSVLDRPCHVCRGPSSQKLEKRSQQWKTPSTHVSRGLVQRGVDQPDRARSRCTLNGPLHPACRLPGLRRTLQGVEQARNAAIFS